MSQAENTNGGLVLAASPMAKKELHIKNVDRINDIFRGFVGDEDLCMYSIDESLLDVTDSWEYLKYKYGHNLTMVELARIIQLEVKDKLGLYLTVGIGDNPVMAKLALDIESNGYSNHGGLSAL